MSVQQIRSNINELVNGIENEDELQACYVKIVTVVEKIKKKRKKTKTEIPTDDKPDVLSATKNGITQTNGVEDSKEKFLSHDLSFAFLANKIFKHSEPLSEAGEIVFEKAFKKSLKKQPTLPNRL